MPDDLDSVITWLGDVHQALSDPSSFFTHHEPRYLAVARSTAIQTMAGFCPPNVEPDAWRQATSDYADLIFSAPLTSGLEIVLAGRLGDPTIDRTPPPGTPAANFTPVTYADVLDWVNAGAENGGKDLTALESARERSPEQIAYDVFYAIRQHRLGLEKKDFSRITQRLEDWIGARSTPAGATGDRLDQMLLALLEAWLATIAPILERDFEDWLSHDILNY